MQRKTWLGLLVAILMAGAVTQCTGAALTPAAADAQRLVLHSWEQEFPPELLDAFTAESGIAVEYIPFTHDDEAMAHLYAGQSYDVVHIDNRFLRPAIEAGLLAPIDMRNIPNFKNVSAGFRDLAFDPNNRHSVPHTWGAMGLVTRRDAVTSATLQWSDLWDSRFCGRIAVWQHYNREMISLTLKSLGYSANSEDPTELAQARRRLVELRPCVLLVEESQPVQYVPGLIARGAIIGPASAYEALTLKGWGLPLAYYAPLDGALIWSDSFVIPANSQHKRAAEAFIDFILRPENGATLVNHNYYRIANDAATPYILPALRDDPDLFPPMELLRQSEIVLPLSPAGEQQYDEIWAAFLAG